MKKDHNYFMKKAFEEANYAFYKDEVPVGCVIVYAVSYTHLTLPTTAYV